MYSSINYLPPHLQNQPIFRDLCLFIDYLEVDIDKVYDNLRYKYIDWSRVSEEGAVQTLTGMGMDYIVDLINVTTPSNSTQLLALCSLIWLLKGQLLGVDIIADICGFKYTYTVWHEQVPLGEPNTATMKVTFIKDRNLTEDFQYNFVEFLRKYLYPVVDVLVQTPTCKGTIYSYSYSVCRERHSFVEILHIPHEMTINALEDFAGTMDNVREYQDILKLCTNIKWMKVDEPWNSNGYYSTNGIWGGEVVPEGTYTSQVFSLPRLYNVYITPELDYKSLGTNQKISMSWKYSEDGVNWTDWEVLTGSTIPALLQYCQFKLSLNAPEQKQMLVYSFKVKVG